MYGLRLHGLRPLGVFLGVLFGILALLSVGVRPARAATFQVTTLADSGTGSLRAAITSANSAAGSIITFKSGLSGTILLASALPALGKSMTLQGPGASVVAVDGQHTVGLFVINSGVTASLSGLTIQSGKVAASGGGVFNGGTLTLTGCTLADNVASFYGGGVYSNSSGTLTLSGCTFTANSSNYGGGGVYSDGPLTLTGCTLAGNSVIFDFGGGVYSDGTAKLTGCTFNNNTAGISGGGVFNGINGTVVVTGCTFTGNSAREAGGGGVCNTTKATASLIGCSLTGGSAADGAGVFNDGVLTLTGCTLVGGKVGNGGGGVYNDSNGTATLSGCTLAGNTAANSGGGVFNTATGAMVLTGCTLIGNSAFFYGGGALAVGTLTLTDDILYGDSVSYAGGLAEIQGPATASHCDIAGDSATPDGSGNFGADPLLAPLGDYGGPTQTFALLPGSPCLSAGIAVSGLTADQRGVAVPQNGRYDIGAFESQGFTVTVTGGSPQSTTVSTAFALNLAATVTANFTVEPVVGGGLAFTGPTEGASATFGPDPAIISSTGGASVKTTANGVAGGPYTVAADTGAGSATYSLTNNAVAPVVTTQPVSQTVTAGQTAKFTAAASGNPTPTVQWQVSTNGGSLFVNITGAASTTYSLTATAGLSGDLYRAVFTNSAKAVATDSATLTVNTAPVVTTNPVSQKVTAGQAATFSAAAGGRPTPTVQWQVSTNGGGLFINIIGATSTTLTLANITASQSGYQYRVVFTNSIGLVATSAATLTVTKAATTTTVSSSLNPSASGQPVTFTATLSGGAGPTGTVTFTVDGTAGAPVALSGTTAPFTTSALAAGPHTVTAAYGGDADNAASTSGALTQTVTPALAALTFLTPVPGGTVLTATVTLSGPALTDTVVGLSSSDSAVIRLFRAVVVPAGSASATFPINTYRSHVSKTVTVYAALGSVTLTKDLTITGR